MPALDHLGSPAVGAPALGIRDPRIRRSVDHLADGREVLWFDDADTPPRPERRRDARVLDARPVTATMRRDPLTGDWVSIAEARQHRAFLPPAHLDPLAVQTPDNPSELPDEYDVAVFENRSPSFGPDRSAGRMPLPTELGATAPAVGRCEVISFSPSPTGSLGTQPVARIRTIVEAWADRTAALSALEGIEQVFCFENRGEAIGVTLQHPHGQVYGYPYVTPRTTALLAQVERHAAARAGADLFADVLAFERAGERMLIEGEHWSAFVPFAARWPIEWQLLPHRHVADLAETTLEERDELARLLPRLLGAVDALYDDPTPYILAWHQAPVHLGRDRVRLMVQLTSPRRAADRLKYLAGSEAAMGAWIGDIVPEAQARGLRDAMARIGGAA